MDDKLFYVYIMTNWKHSVLYIGFTSDLLRRVFQHKEHAIKGFTQKYNCTKIVYFESTSSVLDAITREKQLKGWRREKKEKLIYTENPNWVDLSNGWY